MADDDALSAALGPLWAERRVFERSSDGVYETLREAILSKALRPGQYFGEEDLATVFGVSRTPVREAILRLTSEHLLERRGGRRLSVSEISPTEVLEIYDVRVVLDGLAAELAAKNATPPEIAQLRWINERMKAAAEKGDTDGLLGLNLEFHDWLARVGRSEFLLSQVRGVQDRVRRFSHSTFEWPGRPEQIIEEHEMILAAIESGDAGAASAAAKNHMLASKEVRLAMIDEETVALTRPGRDDDAAAEAGAGT